MSSLCPLCVQAHRTELAHEVGLSDLPSEVVLPDAPAQLFGEESSVDTRTRTAQALGLLNVDVARRLREEFEVEP